MIRHRHIEGICALAMVLALTLTGLLFFGERLGLQAASAAPEETLLSSAAAEVHPARQRDAARDRDNAAEKIFFPFMVKLLPGCFVL